MVTPGTGSLSLAVLSRVPCTTRSSSAAYDGPAAIVTTAKTAIRPANARVAQAVQVAVRVRTADSAVRTRSGLCSSMTLLKAAGRALLRVC